MRYPEPENNQKKITALDLYEAMQGIDGQVLLHSEEAESAQTKARPAGTGSRRTNRRRRAYYQVTALAAAGVICVGAAELFVVRNRMLSSGDTAATQMAMVTEEAAAEDVLEEADEETALPEEAFDEAADVLPAEDAAQDVLTSTVTEGTEGAEDLAQASRGENGVVAAAESAAGEDIEREESADTDAIKESGRVSSAAAKPVFRYAGRTYVLDEDAEATLADLGTALGTIREVAPESAAGDADTGAARYADGTGTIGGSLYRMRGRNDNKRLCLVGDDGSVRVFFAEND